MRWGEEGLLPRGLSRDSVPVRSRINVLEGPVPSHTITSSCTACVRLPASACVRASCAFVIALLQMDLNAMINIATLERSNDNVGAA